MHLSFDLHRLVKSRLPHQQLTSPNPPLFEEIFIMTCSSVFQPRACFVPTTSQRLDNYRSPILTQCTINPKHSERRQPRLAHTKCTHRRCWNGRTSRGAGPASWDEFHVSDSATAGSCDISEPYLETAQDLQALQNFVPDCSVPSKLIPLTLYSKPILIHDKGLRNLEG